MFLNFLVKFSTKLWLQKSLTVRKALKLKRLQRLELLFKITKFNGKYFKSQIKLTPLDLSQYNYEATRVNQKSPVTLKPRSSEFRDCFRSKKLSEAVNSSGLSGDSFAKCPVDRESSSQSRFGSRHEEQQTENFGRRVREEKWLY